MQNRKPEDPVTVTLSDAAWNIVQMSLMWHHDEIGDECPNMKLVHDNIAQQLGWPPNHRFPRIKDLNTCEAESSSD